MPHPVLHDVVRRDFSNGVRLLHVRTNLPISVISLWFPFGSRQDPSGKEGMAHLMEHLLMKTTPKLPTVSDARAFFAAQGMRYNAVTTAESLRFQVSVLSEDVLRVLPLFLEQMQTSYFDDARCESEKRIVTEERERKAQKPLEMLSEWTREALFPGSGIDHSGLGTSESVAGIAYEEVAAFAKENVQDAPKTIVICSPHDAGDFFGLLSKLPSIKRQAEVPGVPRAASVPLPLRIVKNSSPSIHVSLAYVTCGYADSADSRALHLLSTAYLAGGAASRLWMRLREEKHMTYGVQGQTQVYADGGSFSIRFSVPKECLREALDICNEELDRLRNGDIDVKLLETSKREVRFGLRNRCMDPELVSTWYGLREMYGHHLETFDEYCAAIDQLTPEDLIRFARKYFMPERQSLVLVGEVQENDLSSSAVMKLK